MSTFSQVSPQWYTSAGEKAEGRVQQSCLPSRHLCPPGKHTVWTTHLATGSVYVPIYLSIHRSSIYHKSFLTICLVYLPTYLSSYSPIHLSTALLRASSRRQLSCTKRQGRRKRCDSFISHPPPTLTPSHFLPHSSQAMEMFTDLRQFDLAKDFLGGSNQKNVKELITKQADWARTTNDPQAAW